MACMEHHCVSCAWVSFDNIARGPSCCPKCGEDVRSICDEEPDRDDRDDGDDVDNEEDGA
jgi:predicted  nucleic acid-binding Zn-ribbon protein